MIPSDINRVELFWQDTINIPSFICGFFTNVIDILIIESGVSSITAEAFEHCRSLRFLSLLSNNIQSVPDDSFVHLTNVSLIQISNDQLERITARMFSVSNALMFSIFFADNRISTIENGAFSVLTSLQVIDFRNNQMKTIDSRAFGDNLNRLDGVHFDNNQINAIDPFFFDNATRINQLSLRENICVDDEFFGVQNDRINVRNQLQLCFDNFENSDDGSFIRCDYVQFDHFVCDLKIQNIYGRDDFDIIEGEFNFF